MPKFNVYFKLEGPSGTIEAPNSTNPVETESLERCLFLLSEKLVDVSYREFIVGVRIEAGDAAAQGDIDEAQ